MFNNPYNVFPYGGSITPGMMRGIPTPGVVGGMNALGNNLSKAGTVARGSRGVFKALSGIKWGSLLTNTQKTLNVINQAIPVYYQIKPICSNLKSFGKIMSVFNDSNDNNSNNNGNLTKINDNSNQINKQIETTEKKENSQNLPTFFIN